MERDALTQPLTTVVEIAPPGDRLARHLAAVARRTRRRYEVAIGAHRGWDPRRAIVEHRVPGDAQQVLDQLCRAGDIRSAGGGLRFSGEISSLAYDTVDHEYRLRSRLHLAWSWPDLPMRLAVGELSATRSTLRLSLRSRRRLRYPARYFDAAHSALAALERRLDAPSR